MKRTTVLLEEDLLLEIQQLAKEQRITTSQVIQRAVADYVEDQSASHPEPYEETKIGVIERLQPDESPESPVESARPVEEATEPVSPAESTRGFSGLTLIPFILGGLSALFALFEFVRAAGQITGHGQPLEVVINYIVPGILLSIIAAAFFFVGGQSQRSRAP
ncbi:MAG: ribbon-helix-helix protein, CopG family [Chloroflexota bacterium]|nr:ribbon-helix-helix protein, CopG family [Chloroflexota bacterium]